MDSRGTEGSGELTQALIEAGQRLDRRGLVAGSEGNVSARLPDGSLLISASGSFLGRLDGRTLVRIDRDGIPLDPADARPTSERGVHLAAYRLRDEIGAVVHAHPPHALALMMRGEGLDAVPLGEAAYAFGSVPTARFAVPGTDEGGEVVAEWIGSRDALLLDRHGAVTVGRTVDEALARMEMLDAVARVVLLAGGNDALVSLEPGQVESIATAALAAGAHPDAVSAWREAVPVTGLEG